jgi:hypothetical protein
MASMILFFAYAAPFFGYSEYTKKEIQLNQNNNLKIKGLKKRCPGEVPGQTPNKIGWRLT